jgi:polyhydroxybutyrate depolymerase
MNCLEAPGVVAYSLRKNSTRASAATALTALLCLLLASCSLSNAPSAGSTSFRTSLPVSLPYLGPINRPVPTTGCGQASPITAGSSANVTIASNPAVSGGSRTRVYRVHVPRSYNMNRSQAVVLAFHGYSGSAGGEDQASGFTPLADQQDFIAVYPQGLPDEPSGKPFWASVGPIDLGIDDLLFVSNVLNDLQKKFCVDPQRIYASGFSNGGGMTGFLACRLAGRIAAFVPISGNFYALPGGCKPGRPVPILDFHGTKDPLLPYNGQPISVNPDWPLPSIPRWLQNWAARDGCSGGPVIFLNGPRILGERWSGCQGNSEVIHYRIIGGGHAAPPPIAGRSAAEVIWLFFQAHTLSGS